MDVIINGVIGAIQNMATVDFWLAVAIGSIIGLIFGIIPGISGMLALALMLPFVFRMSPVMALPMMMAVMGIQFFGGAVSAILINLPGTPGNAATILDGFKMSENGESGRAIGAAEMSSAFGNVTTAIISLALIPAMLPIIMAITSADMVFIMLLGMAFVAVLSSGTMIKGLISAGVGLLIAFIGFQQSTGVARFTFGSLYLYDGIALVPLALGLFGIPEMIALATTGGSISKRDILFKGMSDVWRGCKDVFHHWPLSVRSAVIGFIVGIIPALGASSACFLAYGQAKQTSKHPEKFGTGTVEGVIAPESANNACEAGALLTTLTLGIPGSGIMALLIGAMLMLGLIPGPEMITKHLDLSLTLFWVVIITGLLGAIVCLPLAPQLAKIAFMPGRILIPLVMVVAFVGSYAYQERIEDVIVLFIFSVLGVLMRRYNFNRPSLFLAFILGGLFEKFLFIAIKVGGATFFVRPISMITMAIIVLLFVWGPIKRAFNQRRNVGVGAA